MLCYYVYVSMDFCYNNYVFVFTDTDRDLYGLLCKYIFIKGNGNKRLLLWIFSLLQMFSGVHYN